jgi:hypothetical protein
VQPIAVAQKFRRLLNCLPGLAFRQLKKVLEIAEFLEEAAELTIRCPNKPQKLGFTIDFDFPPGTLDALLREAKQLGNAFALR